MSGIDVRILPNTFCDENPRNFRLQGRFRRYLMHVLPAGFMRIRHYGFNDDVKNARLASDCQP